MDNFKAVYKILSVLEKSLDLEEVNMELLDHNALGVTKERWNRLNDPPKMVHRSTQTAVCRKADFVAHTGQRDISRTAAGKK